MTTWSEETAEAVAKAIDKVSRDLGGYDYCYEVEYAQAALSAIEQSREVRELVDAAIKLNTTLPEYAPLADIGALAAALKPFTTEASDGK